MQISGTFSPVILGYKLTKRAENTGSFRADSKLNEPFMGLTDVLILFLDFYLVPYYFYLPNISRRVK